MAFAENLQYLRAQQGLTQEQLAERLSVSRQSVSKWESGMSFPEMDKLLELCALFDRTLDDLVRGDLTAGPSPATDTAGYDAHMNWFSRIIAAGVGLLLVGIATSQILESMRLPKAVYDGTLFLAAIPAILLCIVGGMQHSQFAKKHPEIAPFYSAAEEETAQRRFIPRVATGVGLILCGILSTVLGEGLPLPPGCTPEFYDGILLFFLACGVAILVYSGLQKSKYDIASYNKNHLPSEGEGASNPLTDKACGVIMLLATLVFFIGQIGLGWERAWLAFPAGGILCAIVSIVLEKKN